MLKGIAVSSGVAIGQVVRILEQIPEAGKRRVADVEAEKLRFQRAVAVFVEEMEHAVQVVTHNVGASEAGILGAQVVIMQDPELNREVLRTIERDSVCAEYAFKMICDGYIALFSNLEDELISARSADFKDIKNRMLCILQGVKRLDLGNIPAGSVLVAEDIPPSQASAIDAANIRGIVTASGSKFSHIAILARTLQIPTVMGVAGVMEKVRDGDTLLLDGDDGIVRINPSPEVEADFRRREQVTLKLREEYARYRSLPTRTTDGQTITLCANLAMAQELQMIREHHADGIGLFRTEFLYMERAEAPSETHQYEMYRKVAEAMGEKPVIIRTLDVGGDKQIPYLNIPQEENPYLGFRAVRYCLKNPEVFHTQIRAILRAARHGDVRIMIPMVSSVEELRAVRKIIADTERELTAQGVAHKKDIPFGIMIETPAAVFCADLLARESDFFSIGTNDLTQYILAMDRGNEQVAEFYDSLHPAVFKALVQVAEAGRKAGIPVKVCGEAASDHIMIPLLLAAGITDLSVGSGLLLSTRYEVNNLSMSYWQEQLPALLALETAADIGAFVRERTHHIYLAE